MRNQADKIRQEATDSPVAWFAVLEWAKQTSDIATVARVAARLRYVSLRIKLVLLGVVGRLPRPPPECVSFEGVRSLTDRAPDPSRN